jgi:hypothetical protein
VKRLIADITFVLGIAVGLIVLTPYYLLRRALGR